MNNRNLYPPLSEDPYYYPDGYSDIHPETDELAEWTYSQELAPIIPYSDDTSEPSNGNQMNGTMPDMMNGTMPDTMNGAMPDTMNGTMSDTMNGTMSDTMNGAMSDTMNGAMPDAAHRPLPDRPTAPLPPIVEPPRPQPPRPQPPRPQPPRPQPPRPQPPRPQPPRPQPPRPFPPGTDWSWNWGVLLPGNIFQQSTARVRFYNASVLEPLQIYVNNRLVVSNLNFMEYTRYYNVAPGRYRITVYRGSNMNIPILDTWMNFYQNTTYTVTIAGANSNYWLQSLTS